MLDSIPTHAQENQGVASTQAPEKASVFVTGQHTAADLSTRELVLQVLKDIEVLHDTKEFLPLRSAIPKGALRRHAHVEKRIMFLSSLLRASENNEPFSIRMTPHAWTGSPCGYEAARDVTRALKKTGQIITVRKARKGRNATIYQLADGFLVRLQAHGQQLAFKLAQNDIVEVREPGTNRYGRFKLKEKIALSSFPKESVAYEQKRLQKLNAYLCHSPLVDASGVIKDTTLKRIFCNDLKNGGRLYGEYQTMRERDRLRCTLGGQSVCEIDLKASHVSIAAALLNHSEQLPVDPYSAISWVRTASDRKAAKLLVQCIIHSQNGLLRRFPRLKSDKSFKVTYGFEGQRVEELLPGIFEVMPFLEGSPRLTMALQYIESEILFDVLERLQRLNIPALPVHDSLLVREADYDLVVSTFQETLATYLGIHAPWLDVSRSGEETYLVAPLEYPVEQRRKYAPKVSPKLLRRNYAMKAHDGDDIETDELIVDEVDNWETGTVIDEDDFL